MEEFNSSEHICKAINRFKRLEETHLVSEILGKAVNCFSAIYNWSDGKILTRYWTKVQWIIEDSRLAAHTQKENDA